LFSRFPGLVSVELPSGQGGAKSKEYDDATFDRSTHGAFVGFRPMLARRRGRLLGNCGKGLREYKEEGNDYRKDDGFEDGFHSGKNL
jgi:hypothetical protein